MSHINPKQRAETCAALKAATGLDWQANCQDPRKGPDQEIFTYFAPVAALGKLVAKDDILRMIDRCPAGREFDVHVMGFSSWAESFSPYTNIITIPTHQADNPKALEALKSSPALQEGFKVIADAPAIPAVADAYKKLCAGKKCDLAAVLVTSQFAAQARH